MIQYQPHENFVQYCQGVLGTAFGFFLIGADATSAVPWAAVLPACTMLLINLPRICRELLSFYREYKNPSRTDPNLADQPSGKKGFFSRRLG